jgi:hypothetical protein
MRRYALIRTNAPSQVAAYLPENYSVEGITESGIVAIGGEDHAGWTLDGYVLPRLASGLHFGTETDLSDPVFKTALDGREWTS